MLDFSTWELVEDDRFSSCRFICPHVPCVALLFSLVVLIMVDFTPSLQEPRPFDLNCQRYCPRHPFPSYRHIPGLTPHPVKDPAGHSYGIDGLAEPRVLSPEAWRTNEDYLYGVDLYNFAYWWEAHESWEGLWHHAEDDYRLFLQGLIQISAALIKHHMRMPRPARTLSTAGSDKLQEVLLKLKPSTETYMGINLNEFLSRLNVFFAPFRFDSVSEEVYTSPTANPQIRLVF